MAIGSNDLLLAFLEQKIPPSVFLQKTPEDTLQGKLIQTIQELIQEQKEIEAPNIFLQSKDQKVLALFMELDLSILKKKLKMGR